MSQRDSGYARKERDLYETPEWVTDALIPHLPRIPDVVWEPAAGSGKMVVALQKILPDDTIVIGTDIADGQDFLATTLCPRITDAIITNPPYEKATEFVVHSISLMALNGFAAMLLRTDFDHAATRSNLFTDRKFAKKLVLTKRIRWFEGSKGSPSFNHAWFIWDWQHQGAPTLAYGP